MQNKILSVLNTFNYLTIGPFIPMIFPYDVKEQEKINQFKATEFMTYFKIAFRTSK